MPFRWPCPPYPVFQIPGNGLLVDLGVPEWARAEDLARGDFDDATLLQFSLLPAPLDGSHFAGPQKIAI